MSQFEESFSLDVGDMTRDPQTEACLRLWAAKLIMHTRDYADGVAYKPKKTRAGHLKTEPPQFGAAKVWILDDDDSVGSFVWVCELFSLNPERARKHIMWRWRDNVTDEYTPGNRIKNNAGR